MELRIMSRRDSIWHFLRELGVSVLTILGNKYPALSVYRLRMLERRKFGHLLIAAGVIILGYLSHRMPESAPWTVWIVGFVVIFEVGLLWMDYLALAETSNDNLRVVNIFPEILSRLCDFKFPPSYELEEKGNGAIIRSDSLDEWIRTRPEIPLDIRPAGIEQSILRNHKPHLLEAFDYLLVRLHESGKRFFNEDKVSIRTELNAAQLQRDGQPVTIGKTSYIASALTNDACANKLIRAGDRTGAIYADLSEMFPVEWRDGARHFLSLDDSQLSNHAGASTIALFRESNGSCVVVLPVQGISAARSAGLLAPTGSGSLDWADVEQSLPQNLLSVIERGATRELCEEQGLIGLGRSGRILDRVVEEHEIQTYVLGFYRWLDYGGLPQFCCISTLEGVNVEALKPDERELAPLASGGNRRYERRRITSIDALGAFCDDMLSNPASLSLPLAVNLDLIGKLVRDKSPGAGRATLAEFIGKRFPGLE
jgi:hypothetical protein